jgi:hypothetical protein
MVTEIFLRRYLLTDTSLEIFTTSRQSFFFDFADERHRARIITELNKLGPQAWRQLRFFQRKRSDINAKIDKFNNRWNSGKLSNFDYLMELNKLAGRTYNDLGQYPVFPWVISDYVSTTLDLDNPNTFRDLAVPIGAMNSERLRTYPERLKETQIEDERYLYGAFYSSGAVVIGYLIRMEPFTSLHIELQDGKFDAVARLFNSIPGAWQSLHTSTLDFRELIPEFFYLPDFLVNSNNFDLGVSDVQLPPWASSPSDFVQKNRMALESPFVTAVLPHWIDMIFGITSRGKECRSIHNWFSPYFFPEAITPEVRGDSWRYNMIRDYAASFGQAPAQLFFSPHSGRTSAVRSLSNFSRSHIVRLDVHDSILSLEINYKRVTVVTKGFEMVSVDVETENTVSHRLPLLAELSESEIPMMRSLVRTCREFALTATPWDTAFTLSDKQGRPMLVKRLHSQKLSALAISRRFYATASFDRTVMLWRLQASDVQVPYSIISKHRSMVTCLAINEECDACVSSSRNGEVVIVALESGLFVRKVKVTAGDPSHAAVWDDGMVAVACAAASRSVVIIFDQNLAEVGQAVMPASVRHWQPVAWPDGRNYVVLGLKSRRVAVCRMPEMTEVWAREHLEFDISNVALLKNPLAVIVATTCGKVLEFPFELGGQ